MIAADVYILFFHTDGTSVFAEFGAALATQAMNKTLRIFAIGDAATKAAAMFHYHLQIE